MTETVIKPRVLVVVDVSNIYHTTMKSYRKRVDYRKLYRWCESHGHIARAIAYGADRNDEARAFKDILRTTGFEVKFKEPKIYFNSESDGTVRESRKADWDVGIAIDVVQILDVVDIVIFVTADGDLAPCVEHVQSRGRRAFVIGSGISRDLKNVADLWLEIDEHLLSETVYEPAAQI